MGRAEPLPLVRTHVKENDLLVWQFLFQGPAGTPYSGGWYWGCLDIAKDYPFNPPLVKMRTPSGRLETDVWLCRTAQDFHPEGWQPTWTIGGMLMAVLAIMCDFDDTFTAGAGIPMASVVER